MYIAIIGLIIGIVLGFYLPITYPTSYSLYMSVAILAALDSVFGGVRAYVQEKFETFIFITGFFGNAILAGLLAYIGDKLGVPLYYAAIFTFGGRLFQNFAILRRLMIEKIREK
ncbi:MAG: small basic family protein [Anaeromicrobium sp.]|jgi:small basic protein|uniref:small basic family protein n=1 Tax=Anaeromicrobium sp. TaxID=1929132 RepID=UPI0025E4B6BA|nr:small basic family protein [Anaeromicrobium sp.]MCT4592917.1 small basic family protein [Anaeromicrobium sp.]